MFLEKSRPHILLRKFIVPKDLYTHQYLFSKNIDSRAFDQTDPQHTVLVVGHKVYAQNSSLVSFTISLSLPLWACGATPYGGSRP